MLFSLLESGIGLLATAAADFSFLLFFLKRDYLSLS